MAREQEQRLPGEGTVCLWKCQRSLILKKKNQETLASEAHGDYYVYRTEQEDFLISL